MAARSHRSNDPTIRDHQEWLGYLQPNGLVVSPQVLVDQQVIIDRSVLAELQRNFNDALAVPPGGESEPRFGPFLQPQIDGTPDGFAIRFLGWHKDQIDWNTLERETIDGSLVVSIPELGATLSPTAALRSPPNSKPDAQKQEAPKYQLLVEEVEPDAKLDDRYQASHLWETTRSAKFERLLTETGVPLGILSNGKQIRLFYAPRGETAGHLTFDATHMTGTAGRLIVGGLHELLKAFRLTNAPSKALLTALCETSRKYQSTVSAALAEQVLEALYELVRGFQAANDATHGELLQKHLKGDDDAKQDIYRGLLRTLMRSVFLLFAEDRDLLPTSDLYYRNYSLHGLFERLREDDGRHHDTMDSRYGAWPQLLALFRLIYAGSAHPSLALPARHGYLFDPEVFPFLEGRTLASPKPPLVSDGCVYRVLEKLLVLKGERLSYRTLDVEQIGSVYETMMGFRMTVAAGASIALKPKKKGGAPIGLDLDAVLAEKPADRAKYIEAAADIGLTANHKKTLKDADTHDAIVAALDSRVAHAATPRIVPKGAMLLQPSDERRRSGSHYTPRSLTQPIVAKTLEPILAQLGPDARPDQILDLKICDPAMGSGAFLVEVCRQLGKRLEDAWTRHGAAPRVTAQDDLTTLARRMAAQRCVYGVDRNDMAVDLAKLSLWLATLAKDHPFTFLDHALRDGDSLVGLDLVQLEAFHWDASRPKSFVSVKIAEKLQEAIRIREEIRRADNSLFREEQLRSLLVQSDHLTSRLKAAAELVVAAFFSAGDDSGRTAKLAEFEHAARIALEETDHTQGATASLAAKQHAHGRGLVTFHWGLAFPEVFLRPNGGFDCFVGNPPFLGGPVLSALFGGPEYQEWLKAIHAGAYGNCDLVAYFFRRAFHLLRTGGTFGLIATNTIYEGSTRASGLRFLVTNGGQIYACDRGFRWPGDAAVVVSVVHVCRGETRPHVQPAIRNKAVKHINSRLHPAAETADPVMLAANAGRGFMGSGLRGSGFILDKTEHDLLTEDPSNTECLFPLLGGEDLNTHPRQQATRYAINFGRKSLEEASQHPILLEIVRERVKPERDRQRDHGPGLHGKKYWWQYALRSDPLYASISSQSRCLVTAITTSHLAFSFQPIRQVFPHSVVVFAVHSFAGFAHLQSSCHVLWSELLSSSLGRGLRYSVGDAFQTFPLPRDWETRAEAETAGRAYYLLREQIMHRNNEGLTKTYNRYHDAESMGKEIVELRARGAELDRAVLDAYGWTDISPRYEFLPDYYEEDENGNEVPKSIRYRWPDEVRDEVLARLLALNAERHAEEVAAGLVSPDGKRLKRSDDDGEEGEDGDGDDESAPAKPKKAGAKKSPAAKSKGAKKLSGQLEFGGDD